MNIKKQQILAEQKAKLIIDAMPESMKKGFAGEFRR